MPPMRMSRVRWVLACGLVVPPFSALLLLFAGISCVGDDPPPVPVIDANAPELQVVEISAGRNHQCALLSDGAVWCWGNNQFRAIGAPSATAAQCTHTSNNV